jgi:CheY-like chemotaxis protein
MVDDLLDIFRVTHHKVALRTEPLDLARWVRLAVEDHRGGLEGFGLKVVAEAPDEPVWVAADRTRLGQILSNLLGNAAKFTNPGGQVCVRLATDAEARRATVSVRDTGVGIAAEVLPHVFETFTQAEQSLDRRRGGLGLGLALVKGLVELHGGGVRAASPGLGHGAEFAFWLPLGQKAAPPQEAPPPFGSAARGLRILIVEDNLDTAKTLRTLLRRYGHEVAMAHSGPGGVEAARTWKPDVILCDLGLPEMDGYEVARTLRREPATAARLIAVSGYGQEEDLRRSEEAGFDLHLIKPVDPAELQRLLAAIKVGS